MNGPPRTFDSVVGELIQGLSDGSVALDQPNQAPGSELHDRSIDHEDIPNAGTTGVVLASDAPHSFSVLVVDDDESYIGSYAAAAKEVGFSVVTVADVSSAPGLSLARAADIVIVALPEGRHLDLKGLSAVKLQRPDTTLILLTRESGLESSVIAARVRADRHFRKPPSGPALHDSLRYLFWTVRAAHQENRRSLKIDPSSRKIPRR